MGTTRLDFHSTADLAQVARLSPDVVRAVLTDPTLTAPAGRSTLPLVDYLRRGIDFHRVIPAAPIDALTVSVSAPLVVDSAASFVAGVLFRRVHDVVPSPAYDGVAIFGVARAEENLVFYDPPFPDARTEVEFSPPRVGAKYLLEFRCDGQGAITCAGSDGSNVSATGAISVVLFSVPHSVTYTLTSDQYWRFHACTAHWLNI